MVRGRAWTGFEAAVLQEAMRKSVRDFAALLGVESTTVTNWRAGLSSVRPRSNTQAILDTTFDLRATPDDKARFEQIVSEGEAAWRKRHQPQTRKPAAVINDPGDSSSDSSDNAAHEDNMFHLRRVLMGCIPNTPPGTKAEFTSSVMHVWDLFFSAQFSEMERTLPTVLASAYNTIEDTGGELRRQASISLAQLLHASSNLLGYAGQTDLASLALLRADMLAAESGDELTRAAIKGSQSWLLAKNSMYDDAAAYAENAAAEIEPRLSTATPRQVAIWGELLCYAAFAASRSGDYREAQKYLRLCDAAGTQLDDEYLGRPEVSNVFGPTSAASFGVINETVASRPREALKLAAVVSGGGTGIPPTLQSRRLINVAQAQIHNRDDAEAIETLRDAYSVAPEFVGHIPLFHTLTHELLTRHGRQRLDGLVDVVKYLGASIQPVGIQP
ncbi:hypothetical protein [Nocardia sp. NPDC004260]